jgi:transcriptional regulator with XRE-family HTH domain
MNKNPITFDLQLLAKNLEKAREANGKSLKDISDLLGIPSSRLKNYEKGKYIPSLPELESISYIYRIPVFRLAGIEPNADFSLAPNADQLQQLIEIRQEIISTRLLLAREEKGISIKDLAKQTGVTTGRIKRFETGSSQPQIDELINISRALAIDFSEFVDDDSPIGNWQEEQVVFDHIRKLPKDLLEFIADPQNRPHLEVAKILSKIGVADLEQLRDSLGNLLSVISTGNDSH